MDKLDFNIQGHEMQFLEITLETEMAVVAEPGSLMYMDRGIIMTSVLGNGAENQNFIGKLIQAGKRKITGESAFICVFTNKLEDKQKVAFSQVHPGKIISIELQEKKPIIAQKGSFVCAGRGLSLTVNFQKKIGVGFFGGDGFIMQKLQGQGMLFLHAGGAVVEKTLKEGEVLIVEPGCLLAYEDGVDFNLELTSIKNQMFGDSGMFYIKLTGPGKVWLQAYPFSRLADEIARITLNRIPKSTN